MACAAVLALVLAGGTAQADVGALPSVYFSDVPYEHPFRHDIEWLGAWQITSGYADGTFRPDEAVSRQAMAAFLFRLAGRPPYVPPSTPRFSDVPRTHPFYVEISWLADMGIATGYADGSFHPDEAVTREAMSAFLDRAVGRPAFTAPTAATFSDVAVDAAFFPSIEWLASTGITTGYADGTFHPVEAVSRQAMAAFLHRLGTGPSMIGVTIGGATSGPTTRVSVTSAGTQTVRPSFAQTISADGRRVVFESNDFGLVPADTNYARDVFLADRETGQTTRISTGSGGEQADGSIWSPSLSEDGRWLAFGSTMSTLVPGDTNEVSDVFVKDLTSGLVTRVSVGPGGAQCDGGSRAAAMSGDGRWVAYLSTASTPVCGGAGGTLGLVVTDRTTGATTRVVDFSASPHAEVRDLVVSRDGRWIAFASDAATLVPGDVNYVADVFVTDRTTGVTTLVSAGPGGAPADGISADPAISADGRWITYRSYASNLVPGDAYATSDVFLTDRTTGTTTLLSTSATGTFAAWRSYAPSISADGRFVSYTAYRPLPSGTATLADVMVVDRTTGRHARVAVVDSGHRPNAFPYVSALSADGRWLTYDALDPLVEGDTNHEQDVFTTPNPLAP